MAMCTPHLYPVGLDDEQRQRLEDITRNGRAAAKRIRHAQVLLLSDQHRPGGKRSRTDIAQTLGMHVNTVDRIRKRFVLEGEAPALDRKVRVAPSCPPIIDGQVEAHLVAICCSPPPQGRTRWTMQLLADELIKRRIVTRVSDETVRKAVKKTSCSPGVRSAGASPSATPRDSWRKWSRCSTSTRHRVTKIAR